MLNPLPLTIVNPNAFESFQSVKNKLILDSVIDSLSGMLLDTLGTLGNIANFESAGVGSLVNRIIQDTFSQFGISQNSLNYFSFPLNPQKFDVSKRKMISKKYVGSGFDLDTRGEEMRVYSYQGTTGSLMPKELHLPKNIPLWNELASALNLTQDILRFPQIGRNPKLSSRYLSFLIFDKFWEKNNNDLLFIWEDDCYVGRLENYKFNLLDTRPYEIFYNFDLLVYPNFSYNVFTGWITENDFSKIKNNSYQDPQDFDFLGINTGLLPDEIEENRDWFFSLGSYPYEKNKSLFTSAQLKDFNLNINNLTPFELDQLYKINKDIDVFEENVTFKLQNKSKQNNQLVSNDVSFSNNNNEIVKETSIITSNVFSYMP